MKNLYKKGISIAEILITLAVVGVLISLVAPQFSKIRENQVLKAAVGDVLSTLDKAKSSTINSLNSSEYGVHFQSDKVIIFKGTVFSAQDANNETINIVTPANISNVTLGGISGVSGDVYFSRIYGAPNTNGTVTVSTTSLSKTITILKTGSASSN